MRAGTLRHRITIEHLNPNAATTRDAHGGVVEEWLALLTVWGSVEPIRAVERFRADQVEAQVTHRITIRYQAGLTTAMRLVFGTRVFLITSLVNPDERREMLEMLAVEAA